MKCNIYKREVMSPKVQLCYSYRTSRTLVPGGGNGALVCMRQVSNSTTLGTSEVCFTIPKAEVTLRMSQTVEGWVQTVSCYSCSTTRAIMGWQKKKQKLSFPKAPNFFQDQFTILSLLCQLTQHQPRRQKTWVWPWLTNDQLSMWAKASANCLV